MTEGNSDNDGGRVSGLPLYLLFLIQQFYHSLHFTVEETESIHVLSKLPSQADTQQVSSSGAVMLATL